MSELSSTSQFWMNWWVQLAVAMGTVSAVLVALFGQGFRAKFFPPKLSIALADPDGEKTRVQLTWVENNVEQRRSEDARYYRVRVSNGRRWSTANQVQVVLLQVDEPTADGQFAASWVGDIPLTWKHQPLFPTLRTIGPASEVVLCSVLRDKWLQLHPLIAPFNLEVKRRQQTRLILSLQARSNECDSPLLRVQVSWDGRWHDGTQEMRRHLVLEVVDEAGASSN